MSRKKTFLTGAVLTLLFAAAAVFAVRTMKPASAAPLVIKDHKLYLLDTTLGEKRLPTAADVELLFDRKGGSILFGERWEGAAPDAEDAGGARLRLMQEDGNGERAVTDDLVRAAFFDRAGKTVYYTTASQDLYSIHTDLTERKPLATKILDADLSPDGRFLVYQKLNPDWRPGDYYDRALGLTLLDIASGKETRLSSSWEDFSPLWTPDSRQIVFFSRSPEGLASEFIVGADGQGRRQLTNLGQKAVTDATVPVPSEQPSWSPDGRRLVYESDRQIWLNELSPGKDRVLSAKALGYGKHPEWADGGASVRVLVGKGDDVENPSTVRFGLDGKLLK